ncbi:MAG TPA: copper resistance system multicopper oxidase [Steroidobacteraceae bacterium]
MSGNDATFGPRLLLSRRRFVEGLAWAGCAGGALWHNPLRAALPGAVPATLSGAQLELLIAPLAVNVTGRRRLATAVNGSMPGPSLRLQEGETVTIKVTNHLAEPTSIHWHGVRLPSDQDGVPGLSFHGIPPGQSFSYRFPVRQGGTYWYHSHSGMQEQTGLAGALLLVPRAAEPYAYDRDYVVLLADWTDEDPMTVASNLKQQSDYYNFQQRTLGTLANDIRRAGVKATLEDRLMWERMRMNPTDLMDVTGSTYTFLINGQPPAANWTGLFAPGEKVRLRFINASAMTTFDVRIPGLPLTIVAADGNDVEPVAVEEFRIAPAETYDAIVAPPESVAYAIFAQAQDRSGFARATLAPRDGMVAAVPPLDRPALRTASDMGMSDMQGMAAMSMPGMAPMAMSAETSHAGGGERQRLAASPFVDNVATHLQSRVGEAGAGLDGNGRHVLRYTDLKALTPDTDGHLPVRELEFHLTGNMERWVWGFDGRKFSEAAPIHVALGERVRFVLINDTMMEHPLHLHGFLFSLENGHEGQLPLKHTVNVKPDERLSFIFTADTPGYWAFHCHLLYHMEAGMFRTVIVA